MTQQDMLTQLYTPRRNSALILYPRTGNLRINQARATESSVKVKLPIAYACIAWRQTSTKNLGEEAGGGGGGGGGDSLAGQTLYPAYFMYV